MEKFLAVIMVPILLLLCGCDRYQVKLNDRELYSPPVLFTDYKMPDSSLNSCIKQTIIDQKITSAEQLTNIICTYGGINDLSGLVRFTQLNSINLSNNEIIDIKPLMFLGELKQVNLAGNPNIKCKDLEALSKLLLNKVSSNENCLQ